MKELRLSLIQTYLYWEDTLKNREHFDILIDRIDSTDLIILPETFSTAFSMSTAKIAEKMDGVTIDWMRKKAEEKQAVLCGSLIIEEHGNYYNRLIWMKPNGSYEHYDKRHLFRMGGEDQHFSSGEKQCIVKLNGWKICPLICYDLRFPVWSRNKIHFLEEKEIESTYDLLIYIANWPEVRVSAWEKLLYARAIENQAYVAAVNRVGEDGNGVNCSGNSMLIDEKGSLVWKAKDQLEEIKTLSLDPIQLMAFRRKFPVGLDADQFKIS